MCFSRAEFEDSFTFTIKAKALKTACRACVFPALCITVVGIPYSSSLCLFCSRPPGHLWVIALTCPHALYPRICQGPSLPSLRIFASLNTHNHSLFIFTFPSHLTSFTYSAFLLIHTIYELGPHHLPGITLAPNTAENGQISLYWKWQTVNVANQCNAY